MKHHCHCGLGSHLRHFRTKRFGILGVVFVGLHLLFHVVECLILPALLVALGGHTVEETAVATSQPSFLDNTFQIEKYEPAQQFLTFDSKTKSIILFADTLRE